MRELVESIWLKIVSDSSSFTKFRGVWEVSIWNWGLCVGRGQWKKNIGKSWDRNITGKLRHSMLESKGTLLYLGSCPNWVSPAVPMTSDQMVE